MNDRGMKKWRPFSSVVPSRELLKNDQSIDLPTLLDDEIAEFEELIKNSMYTHSKVAVTYIQNGQKREIEDYVQSVDPIKKDIYFHSTKINFRQIIAVKKK